VVVINTKKTFRDEVIMIIRSVSLSAVFLFLCAVAFEHDVLACECDSPEVCTAYSRAERVFAGRALAVKEFDSEGRHFVKVEFEVEKLYKGSSIPKQEVVFERWECVPIRFAAGVEYLVYVNRNGDHSPCNRTTYLKGAKLDLSYIDGLSNDRPVFTVHGSLGGAEGVPIASIRNAEVYIKDSRGRVRVALNEKSEFDWQSRITGQYEVEIHIPLNVGVIAKDDRAYLPVQVTNDPTSTVIRYILSFKPNECDYREISIYKVE
jgi:hypothetical protein